MGTDLPILIRAIQSVLALYGVVFVISAIFWPRWFLATFADRLERLSLKSDSMLILGFGATLFSVGVLIYYALWPIFSVVPTSWGGEDEYGDFVSLRSGLQSVIALLGTSPFVERIICYAQDQVSKDVERDIRTALAKSVRQSGSTNTEHRLDIAIIFKEYISKVKYNTKFENEFKDELADILLKNIQ